MNRPSVAWAGLAVALGGLFGCGQDSSNNDESRNGSPVTVTPCGFDGVEAAIAANKGKVVLIDCWATWCGPCVASFPKLVEKHEKYGPRGLAVISLSLDSPAAAGQVIGFLRDQKATFTNLHLNKNDAARKGIRERLGYQDSIPHAALFDRTGARVWAGHPMDHALEDRIEAELAKPNP